MSISTSKKILSWDVGVKNLAYCILEQSGTTTNIISWGVIDLRSDITTVNHICCGKCKNGNTCSSKAVYNADGNLFCKRHLPEGAEFALISPTSQPSIEKAVCSCKLKKGGACGTAPRWQSKTDNSIHYCNKHKPDTSLIKPYTAPAPINCKKIPLLDLGKAITIQLDKCPEFLDVDVVVIENQPSKAVIKNVQLMLFQYFIMRGICATGGRITDVVNYSASNKLTIYKGSGSAATTSETSESKTPAVCEGKSKKGVKCSNQARFTENNIKKCARHCDNSKTAVKLPTAAKVRAKKNREKYADRKKKAIVYCGEFLKTQYDQWFDLFKGHSKKDDLSDCCLQGLHYLGVEIN